MKTEATEFLGLERIVLSQKFISALQQCLWNAWITSMDEQCQGLPFSSTEVPCLQVGYLMRRSKFWQNSQNLVPRTWLGNP
jgi:hypothetical protein